MRDDPQLLPVWLLLDLYDRRFTAVVDRYEATSMELLEPHTASRASWIPVLAYEHLGDERGSRSAAESELRRLRERLAAAPNNPYFLAYAGVLQAYLGHSEAALDGLGQAAELLAGDRFSGPQMRELEAMARLFLGEKAHALEILAELLATSYQHAIMPVDLELNPLWDPVRDDPDFGVLHICPAAASFRATSAPAICWPTGRGRGCRPKVASRHGA